MWKISPVTGCLEHRSLCRIDNQLKKYGKRLWQTHHMFLPDMEITPVKDLVPVRWHEQENLHSFYAEKRFPNALCSRFMPARPDMLAVAAYDGEQIIAMAGCSADTPELWQIGIDVQEQYRGRGIGTYLVTLLKNETIRRGKIPFYGTSLSNLPSWRIALNSGFFPPGLKWRRLKNSFGLLEPYFYKSGGNNHVGSGNESRRRLRWQTRTGILCVFRTFWVKRWCCTFTPGTTPPAASGRPAPLRTRIRGFWTRTWW